jgi:hypothetical protein
MAKPSPKETGPAGSSGKLLLQLSEYLLSGSFPFVAKSAQSRRNVNLPSLGDGTSPGTVLAVGEIAAPQLSRW